MDEKLNEDYKIVVDNLNETISAIKYEKAEGIQLSAKEKEKRKNYYIAEYNKFIILAGKQIRAREDKLRESSLNEELKIKLEEGIRIINEYKEYYDYHINYITETYGGKKTSKKEVLGKIRCIYKIPGDRKEYVKYKGKLITVKDYKMLNKKPGKVTNKKPKTVAKDKKAKRPKKKST